MIQPGDIVMATSLAKARDRCGYTWYMTGNDQLVREYRPLSKRVLDQVFQKVVFGKNPVSLICVPGNAAGSPLVSFQSYEQPLLEFYYEKDGGVRKGCLRIVFKRWREIVNDPDKFSVSPAPRLEPPNQITLWVILEKKNKWKMPALASRYSNLLAGDARWRFCPSPPSILIENYLCPCCYCTDVRPLPVRFSADIRPNQGADARQCTIVLHGFLQPERWHYKFWKHPVAGTLANDQEEQARWKDVLASPIPSTSLFASNGCRERLLVPGKSKGCCEPCSVGQFSLVHGAAGGTLREYLESGVTFLANATTREIRWKEIGDKGVALVDIAAKGPHDATFYRLLLLKGVCYDWDASSPTVFLYPWTYYFRRSRLPLWPSVPSMYYEWQGGRVENVAQTD